jgi:hypothetical protein
MLRKYCVIDLQNPEKLWQMCGSNRRLNPLGFKHNLWNIKGNVKNVGQRRISESGSSLSTVSSFTRPSK